MPKNGFSDALLDWFDQHGRKHLPWQSVPTPYRVWVSEIMLQQTKVTTVIAYYQRFIHRFPDVHELASSPADEVLHLWSGLGYYARARNLHHTAQIVCEQHDGEFPRKIEMLQLLPGIGRSTAGAILALAAHQRHAILDGNVKRVLCRYHAVSGWPGKTTVSRQLWKLAEHHTPQKRIAAYTQAIMDLGATVCTRSKPRCESCPLASRCQACIDGTQTDYPARKPKTERPKRDTVFIIVRDTLGQMLLERRPPTGVWGGLWGFPECSRDSDPRQWCERHVGLTPMDVTPLPVVHHGFTHYDLDIQPMLLTLGEETTEAAANCVMETGDTLWYNPNAPANLGLAAPVATLLKTLETPDQ